MGGQLHPAFCSHSWGLSPSGTVLLWLIVLRAEPSALTMKRVSKKLLGLTVMGIDGLCPSKWSVLVNSRVMEVGVGLVETAEWRDWWQSHEEVTRISYCTIVS